MNVIKVKAFSEMNSCINGKKSLKLFSGNFKLLRFQKHTHTTPFHFSLDPSMTGCLFILTWEIENPKKIYVNVAHTHTHNMQKK